VSKKRIFETLYNTYTEVEVIGDGGTSIVIKVIDDEGSFYAAKLLKAESTIKHEVIKRFRNEVHFCQNQDHPNIIKVIDSGVIKNEERTCPFYIMPLYDQSLRKLMSDGIKKEDYFAFLSNMLDGLEAAHMLEVVHRDIKPENILYSRKKNALVIADFGIAAYKESEMATIVETKPGSRLANFQYASPEQRMRGKTIDFRTDIYSLGLIINEMVTTEIAAGTSYKLIGDVYPEYAYMDKIVEKMIANSPEDRYSSISDLKKDLIALNAERLQLQRLAEAEKKVIKITEISEKEKAIPSKIINVDWANGRITIFLDNPVNQKWINALNNMGSYSSAMGKGPETFQFSDNRVINSAQADEVQPIVDHFVQWLPSAKSRYLWDIEEEKKQEEHAQIEERKRLIAKEEERLHVLKNIKY
jgi:serine/threonine protein kinase